MEEGVISPGGIGFDINCGMRSVITNLTLKEVQPKIKELTDTLFKLVPAGVGCKGFVKVNNSEFNEVMQLGSKWCVEKGYGWQEDLERTEDYGTLKGADPEKVSQRAVNRGINQLGTLGSGNHYLEVQIAHAEDIYDEKTAKKLGIVDKDQVIITTHCLPGNSKILTEYGSWIKIRDLENKRIRVKCFDMNSHKIIDTKIKKLYKISEKERLYKITTKSGRKIYATEDHPLLTTKGLKLINEINKGIKIALNPFNGVEHEECKDKFIINEKNIRQIYNSDIIIKKLNDLSLLPLKMGSDKLPIITKLIGYITGDGHIRKVERGYRINLNGQEEDLKKIKEDLTTLGIGTPDIRFRITYGKTKDYFGNEVEIRGKTYILEINSTALAVLLVSLGCPEGRKTIKKFQVPQWIVDSPLWIKRLYLASYFGAEMTSPIIYKIKNKNYIERPTLAIYKTEKIKKNGIKFISQLKNLLKEFDIDTNKIHFEKGRLTNVGKTIKIVLRISSKLENLTNFFNKVGYEYCKEKIIRSSHVNFYLSTKQYLLEKEADKRKVSYKSIKFLEFTKRIFEYPLNIEQFITQKLLNPPSEVVWDEIEKIKEIENKEKFVYDIEVEDCNHNFIADNFIVGNCGSRGFGHEVATEYLKVFDRVMKEHKIHVPDRELSCAPFKTQEAQDYYSAMKCSGNMAYANRQVIMHRIREAFQQVFKQDAEKLGMHLIYDCTHNLAREHKIKVDGKTKKVLVHLKGATTSVGPGYERLTKPYQDLGSPIIIGGSMETGSYLMLGTKKAEEETFATTIHGAGRTMSRTKAKKAIRGEALQRKMMEKGIYVRGVSMSGLAEEAGFAYKDLEAVGNSVEKAGISKRIVLLKPISNVKG